MQPRKPWEAGEALEQFHTDTWSPVCGIILQFQHVRTKRLGRGSVHSPRKTSHTVRTPTVPPLPVSRSFFGQQRPKSKLLPLQLSDQTSHCNHHLGGLRHRPPSFVIRDIIGREVTEVTPKASPQKRLYKWSRTKAEPSVQPCVMLRIQPIQLSWKEKVIQKTVDTCPR